MRWIGSSVLVALCVSGCATAPTPEQVAAADIAQCSSFGAGPGTPKYPDCRMFMVTKRQVERQERLDRLAVAGQSLKAAGQAMKSPRTVHTSCSRDIIGGFDCTSD
jgi:hypothetical protein